jgi:ABC-type amino acid transport substrate-binding protein
MKVVVYSHDADVRAQVRLAIGRRPAMDVPEAEIIEVATQPALFRLLDAGGADVMVLDGEAQPIALAHELAGLMRERPAVSG